MLHVMLLTVSNRFQPEACHRMLPCCRRGCKLSCSCCTMDRCVDAVTCRRLSRSIPPPVLLDCCNIRAAHLPFSHHNLTPNLKRSKGETPMPFTPRQIPKGESPEAAEARPCYTTAHKAPLATFDFPSGMFYRVDIDGTSCA
jgi:hypothetical protein